ncbi:MAG: LytR C-terminal domain-containing protein [Acidimicrobiales bacterium]
MSDQPEAPRRRRRQPPQAPPAQGSPAKGVILVVVAVLIGFGLLQDQDSSTAQVAVGADDDPATVDEGDGAEVVESTTTTAPARPPSEVKVLVANGSEVNGAAGAQADALEALGYVTANPANAELVPATVVYFTPGYQAEAEELAAAINADPAAVTALPTPAPVADMQLSNVLVVVGPDLATTG